MQAFKVIICKGGQKMLMLILKKKKKKSRMVCIAMLPFVAPKKDGKSV